MIFDEWHFTQQMTAKSICISSDSVHTVLTDLGDELALCKIDPKNADEKYKLKR